MEPVDDVQWFLNQVSRDFPEELEAFTQPDPDALRESLALLLQIKRQAGYQSEYPPTAAAYPRTAMAAASAGSASAPGPGASTRWRPASERPAPAGQGRLDAAPPGLPEDLHPPSPSGPSELLAESVLDMDTPTLATSTLPSTLDLTSEVSSDWEGELLLDELVGRAAVAAAAAVESVEAPCEAGSSSYEVESP